jgi:hypothetical protein
MRIKVRHLQAALSVLAEEENGLLFQNIAFVSDALDEQIKDGERHPDDVLIEFS